jgi:hypothetical protein
MTMVVWSKGSSALAEQRRPDAKLSLALQRDRLTGTVCRTPQARRKLGNCWRIWKRTLAKGTPYVILDGKVVDTDRCREKPSAKWGQGHRRAVRGKAHEFGGNDPDGAE